MSPAVLILIRTSLKSPLYLSLLTRRGRIIVVFLLSGYRNCALLAFLIFNSKAEKATP